MSIAEKLITVQENVSKVYEAGKEKAVLSGVVSFTDMSKTLAINGLSAPPKSVNIFACSAVSPTDDNQYFIRGLDYEAEGFYYGTSTQKMVACLWLATTKNISDTAAANGSISERINNNYNILSYADGTFTIRLQENNKYYFGENYTYRWTVVF